MKKADFELYLSSVLITLILGAGRLECALLLCVLQLILLTLTPLCKSLYEVLDMGKFVKPLIFISGAFLTALFSEIFSIFFPITMMSLSTIIYIPLIGIYKISLSPSPSLRSLLGESFFTSLAANAILLVFSLIRSVLGFRVFEALISEEIAESAAAPFTAILLTNSGVLILVAISIYAYKRINEKVDIFSLIKGGF